MTFSFAVQSASKKRTKNSCTLGVGNAHLFPASPLLSVVLILRKETSACILRRKISLTSGTVMREGDLALLLGFSLHLWSHQEWNQNLVGIFYELCSVVPHPISPSRERYVNAPASLLLPLGPPSGRWGHISIHPTEPTATQALGRVILVPHGGNDGAKRLRRTGIVKEGKEEKPNTWAKMSTKRQSTKKPHHQNSRATQQGS